jgi:uncharacterized SAM-binding protein YcdF (DUF218 family)
LKLSNRSVPKPRRKRGCLSFFFALFLACLLVWILRAPFCTLAGNALVEDDGPAKADAIVVLGGDAYGTRIVRGAELKKSGYASRILVSGPSNLLGHETDQTVVYAAQKGYPASLFEVVPLPIEISSTRTEAQYIGKQLQEQGATSIDLVTSNFHTRRAAWLWRKQNPWLRINVVPAPDPNFTPEKWFTNREGQKTFVMEWSKTLASHLGY